MRQQLKGGNRRVDSHSLAPVRDDSDVRWWHDVDTPEDLRRAGARLRRSLTKEADGPVSRYLNRPVSTRVSMALAHLPIHPDVISLTAFLLGVLAAWLLASGRGIAGGILAQLASILDGVDGDIAASRCAPVPEGPWLTASSTGWPTRPSGAGSRSGPWRREATRG